MTASRRDSQLLEEVGYDDEDRESSIDHDIDGHLKRRPSFTFILETPWISKFNAWKINMWDQFVGYINDLRDLVLFAVLVGFIYPKAKVYMKKVTVKWEESYTEEDFAKEYPIFNKKGEFDLNRGVIFACYTAKTTLDFLMFLAKAFLLIVTIYIVLEILFNVLES